MSKYQLLITVASLGELQTIAAHLEKLQGGMASATVEPLTGKMTTLPVIPSGGTDEEDEDEAGETVDPSVIFGTAPPAGTFASPNVAATVAPLVPNQPVQTAVSTIPAGVELDPRGFPWDARIHASTRTRLAKDNTWKKTRGVPETTVVAVEAELRAQGFGNPGEVHTPAPTAAATLAPALPVLPGAPALPVINKPVGPTAESITERFTRGLQAQIIDAPWIMSVLAAYGIVNLQDLGNHPDKFVVVNNYLTEVRDSNEAYKVL